MFLKEYADAFPGTYSYHIGRCDRRLAHTLCINCHVVDTKIPTVRTDRVPSFVSIARRPGLTPEYVAVWLSTSHETMKDYTLSRDEIRQLTAYILSLRPQ
jgi:hypothetical protein